MVVENSIRSKFWAATIGARCFLYRPTALSACPLLHGELAAKKGPGDVVVGAPLPYEFLSRYKLGSTVGKEPLRNAAYSHEAR